MLTIAFAIYSDKLQKRSPFILSGQLLAVIGFAILLSDAPSGVHYFGTFLSVAGPYAAFPGVIAWCVLSRVLYTTIDHTTSYFQAVEQHGWSI